MKLFINIIIIIFISFGANAKLETFDILKENIPASECVKALEKGTYIYEHKIEKGSYLEPIDEYKGEPVFIYLLDGYLYQFAKTYIFLKHLDGITVTAILRIRGCKRSKNIY